jgi:hypothetical protein
MSTAGVGWRIIKFRAVLEGPAPRGRELEKSDFGVVVARYAPACGGADAARVADALLQDALERAARRSSEHFVRSDLAEAAAGDSVAVYFGWLYAETLRIARDPAAAELIAEIGAVAAEIDAAAGGLDAAAAERLRARAKGLMDRCEAEWRLMNNPVRGLLDARGAADWAEFCEAFGEFAAQAREYGGDHYRRRVWLECLGPASPDARAECAEELARLVRARDAELYAPLAAALSVLA